MRGEIPILSIEESMPSIYKVTTLKTFPTYQLTRNISDPRETLTNQSERERHNYIFWMLHCEIQTLITKIFGLKAMKHKET